MQIPDPNPTTGGTALAVGTTNAFVSDVPTVTIKVKFVGADASAYASKVIDDATRQMLLQVHGG